MGFTNSGLVDYTRISPNKTTNRNHVIDRITPHCYVGQVTVEDMCAWLCNPSAEASANYVIGKDGRLGLNVEEKDRAWTSSSSANDNRAVTIECASNTSGDYAVNDKVYNKLIELCVDVCRRNGKSRLLWLGGKEQTLNYQPRADECLLSAHRWFANKACPGDFLYSRYGQIADAVTAALGGMPMPTGDKYVVRLAFDQPKTQTNSYNNLEYAKLEADRYPGYSVYVADTGDCVYTSPKETGYTPDEWISMIAPIAQDLARINQILPSVVIGQTCVETGFGKTDLTRRFNVVGMKADLINSTWQEYTVWDGETYGKESPEGDDGGKKYSLFRVYKSFRQCLEDYEAFLLHVRNDKGLKYARIKGWTDPAKVIRAIRIGTGTVEHPEGYATDSKYEQKVLDMIARYNLTQYDEVMPGEEKDRYAVQRSLGETQFRLGLFHVFDNAKQCANENWGYKVYDIITDKLVYEPQLTIVEKLIAKCLQFDQFVQWDNAHGHQWRYYNNKRSAPTFWQTRDQGLYMTNCAGAVIFTCKDIGIPASALQWYGTKGGVHFLTDHAKKDAEKYFDFIEVKNMTVRQAVKKGVVLPGDILTYMTMSHTNIYFGVDMSYDAGHAYCIGSGEGAKYQRWIGGLAHPSTKVAVIARLKQAGKGYRVQVGAYKTKASAEKKAATVKELTKYASLYAYEHNKNKSRDGYDCFVEQGADGKWRTYCGSFESKTNAEKRHDELESKYKIDALVVEV